MVIWITGLSCSGKTLIGKELFQHIRLSHPNTVFLDGDDVRQLFGESAGHTLEGRALNAQRFIKLCEFFDRSNIHVVGCILSVFPKNQLENRSKFNSYFEINIDVPLKKIIQRDNKGLYEQAISGNLNNVVGVDIEYPDQSSLADITIDNSGVLDLDKILAQISRAIPLRFAPTYPFPQGDLLEKPHKYEYIPFQGTPFIEAYQSDRALLVKQLHSRLDFWNTQIELPEFQVQNAKPENCLDTYEFFQEILSKDTPPRDQINSFLVLIKRFEVSKKIALFYFSDWKKSEAPRKEVWIYIYFAQCLTHVIQQNISSPISMICTNALLKTCDIIHSQNEQIIHPTLLNICLKVLLFETNLISQLQGGTHA